MVSVGVKYVYEVAVSLMVVAADPTYALAPRFAIQSLLEAPDTEKSIVPPGMDLNTISPAAFVVAALVDR
jgi:hypothetical protein